MGKRKRDGSSPDRAKTSHGEHTNGHAIDTAASLSVQIIAGSYERVLHGFVAKLSPQVVNKSAPSNPHSPYSATFSSTFLFAAHSSSIRHLAISHNKENQKCILATGGSDERINLYTISATEPDQDLQQRPKVPSLDAQNVVENAKNKELGSLLHHSRPVTKLHFPTPGKLFSASEDNTIAITRTRDWNVLSAMKAPVPKPVGRPSGDTAAPGEVPAGVNDFAVHPSNKIMMSVGRGEKCMRLWNLVTGKKAGALNFGKDLLRQVGEGRFGVGEGRKILWAASLDGKDANAELVVSFERAAALFGQDCEPKAILNPSPTTKVHDLQSVPSEACRMVAISTEDGRVLFFDLDRVGDATDEGLPTLKPCAQIGGPNSGVNSSRIKAFTFITTGKLEPFRLICITVSSDGSTRLWGIKSGELEVEREDQDEKEIGETGAIKQLGTLLATHESGNRLTCLAAFEMDSGARVAFHGEAEDDAFAGFSSEVDE